MWLDMPITQCLTLTLVLLVSTSSGAQRADPQLSKKIAVCGHMADVFPSWLPSTCTPGDQLTRENGGLVEFQIHLNCHAILHCSWACVSKKHQGPTFKVKRGPWTLCELCFSPDFLPNACFEDLLPRKRSRRVPSRQPGSPGTPTPTPTPSASPSPSPSGDSPKP